MAAGAWFLERLAAHLPAGTVLLAVVDPGVGSGRPAVACTAGGQFFVGPATALLALLLPAPDLAVAVLDKDLHRGAPGGRPVSATFHGRDLFAPAAAQLAMGVPLDQVGTPAAARGAGRPAVRRTAAGPCSGSTASATPSPTCAATARPGARIAGGGAVRLGPHRVPGPALTYAAAPPGEPFWYWGSGGTLEVAVRGASAAAQLGLQPGLALRLPEP